MQEVVAGRYRLDEQIGHGGMAEVWRATDLRSGTTVALKRLHPGLAIDRPARTRFRREVAAARAVRHAAAVRILDAGVDGEVPWLVMEHVPGGSLADRLREGALPLAEATAIGADVASALAALHAAGLVHRDVTPSNILLPPGGGARLGDFGIARPWDIPGADDATLTGDLVGTLRFVAPEVLAGEAAAPAGDVWALGAVLYEAVTGRRPFDASSPAALLASQRTPPPLAGIDPALAPLLGRMLDPDPTRRPAATSVASSLARVAGHVAADVRTRSRADEGTVVVASAVPSRAAGVARVASIPAMSDGIGRAQPPGRSSLLVRRPIRRIGTHAARGLAAARGSDLRAPALVAVGLLLLVAAVLGAATLDRSPTADVESPAVSVDVTPEATPPVEPQPADAGGGNGGNGNGGGGGNHRGSGNGNGGGHDNGNGGGNGD
jgi:eukaryotic-like serine/threonine-protein kinase